GQHPQMRDRDDRMNHAADPDAMHRAATGRRRNAIKESDADRHLLHQAREREVVIATIEIHRFVAHHDWASALDIRKRRPIGFDRLANLDARIELPPPVLPGDSMWGLFLDGEYQP